jgi:hypothetical protein
VCVCVCVCVCACVCLCVRGVNLCVCVCVHDAMWRARTFACRCVGTECVLMSACLFASHWDYKNVQK